MLLGPLAIGQTVAGVAAAHTCNVEPQHVRLAAAGPGELMVHVDDMPVLVALEKLLRIERDRRHGAASRAVLPHQIPKLEGLHDSFLRVRVSVRDPVEFLRDVGARAALGFGFLVHGGGIEGGPVIRVAHAHRAQRAQRGSVPSGRDLRAALHDRARKSEHAQGTNGNRSHHCDRRMPLVDIHMRVAVVVIGLGLLIRREV
mmetsp:Transcript_61132/g.157655  ORF Transcript_61132/g.157655 Transcript_61132/m.157655 type:complete len:201 (-) Transcript_61132:79-681(-)